MSRGGCKGGGGDEERKAVAGETRRRYRRASRWTKTKILDEGRRAVFLGTRFGARRPLRARRDQGEISKYL